MNAWQKILNASPSMRKALSNSTHNRVSPIMAPVPVDATLKEMFHAYNSFGGNPDKENMDGRTFAKLASEKKLLTSKCTTTDIDLIFASTKTKGQKKINFNEFIKCLEKVIAKDSAKFGTDLSALVTYMTEKGGPIAPKSSGTKADAVRLHDDKEVRICMHVHMLVFFYDPV